MALTREQFQKLRDKGLSPRQIANFEAGNTPQTQQPPREKSLFQKASSVGEKLLSKPSEFLFGSTAKTIGGLVTRGIGGVKTLTADTPEELAEAKRLSQVGADKSVGGQAIDTAFTALELFPGGGIASNFFKRLPGSSQITKHAEDIFNFIPDKLRNSVAKQFEKVLEPTKQKFKTQTQRLAGQGAERLPVASSKERLLGKVESKVSEAGEAIDNVIDSIPDAARIKTQTLLDDLAKYKEQFKVAGDKGKEFVIDSGAIKQVDAIANQLTKFTDEAGTASFNSLRILRQAFDKAVAKGNKEFGRTLSEGSLLDTQRALSNSIRNEFAKDFPDLAKVNKEFAFWKGISNVLEETVKRTTGRGTSLKTKATAIIGGTAAGIPGLLTAIGADKLITSTAWRTLDIKLKTKLADAIASGSALKINDVYKEIIKRIGIGVKNIND